MHRKYTIETDESTIRLAEAVARDQNTTVSELFSRLIHSVADTPWKDQLPPLTREALGIISLPSGKSDRELIEEALEEKHGKL